MGIAPSSPIRLKYRSSLRSTWDHARSCEIMRDHASSGPAAASSAAAKRGGGGGGMAGPPPPSTPSTPRPQRMPRPLEPAGAALLSPTEARAGGAWPPSSSTAAAVRDCLGARAPGPPPPRPRSHSNCAEETRASRARGWQLGSAVPARVCRAGRLSESSVSALLVLSASAIALHPTSVILLLCIAASSQARHRLRHARGRVSTVAARRRHRGGAGCRCS